GEGAVVVRRREVRKHGIQSEKAIKGHSIGLFNGDAWPGTIITVVLQRGHHVQAIGASAQKDDNEGVALVVVASGVCLERAHSTHLKSRRSEDERNTST